jgi:phenylalanine-4-hydroxylase
MGKETKYTSHELDENGNVPWTEQENKVWKALYDRQMDAMKGRACQEFIDGVKTLNLSPDRVPQPKEITKILQETTGWSVEPVPAVIPAKDFFTLLANKKFPAATFIRTMEELDYLQEPDIFHEVFGHCALLTNQAYADFVEAYGKLSLAGTSRQRKLLFRIFWYTIEFGLMHTPDGVRIFGGGILSSFEETLFAVKEDHPPYLDFDTDECLRTPFRIDIVQPQYFVTKSFDELYKVMTEDLMSKVDNANELGDYKPVFDYDPESGNARYN